MPLKDATIHPAGAIPAEQGALWAVLNYGNPASKAAGLAEPRMAPKSEAIEAYVNEGRWVVECPDCAGAQLACLTDPRFMCCECGNVVVDGRWRPVLLPAARTREAIGKILEPRLTLNQHWRPGETVADLKRENREHDVAVP